MGIENWGLLQKSQVDNETIEEAIVRLITAHNDDETAHLGVGQSLQTHAASEIIDHLADSIISDKILNNQITSEQFALDERFYFHGLQSLDNFAIYKTGTGSDILSTEYNSITLKAGATINYRAYIALISSAAGMLISDNPVFSCVARFNSMHGYEMRYVIGTTNPWQTNKQMIGFKIDTDAEKIYAFYVYSVSGSYTESSVEVGGYNFDGSRLRVEVDSENNEIRWYLDSVLVRTADITGQDDFDYESSMFSFGINTLTAGAVHTAYAENIYFTKKHAIQI